MLGCVLCLASHYLGKDKQFSLSLLPFVENLLNKGFPNRWTFCYCRCLPKMGLLPVCDGWCCRSGCEGLLFPTTDPALRPLPLISILSLQPARRDSHAWGEDQPTGNHIQCSDHAKSARSILPPVCCFAVVTSKSASQLRKQSSYPCD